MSECVDQRLGQMLFPYELGQLDDREEQQFELHLLKCEHCYKEAQQFEPVARHIQHDSGVRESIRQIAEEDSASIVSPDERKPFFLKRLRPRFVPVFVAAAVVLLILILRPVQLEFRPTQEAVADQDRLAIMYFDNLADPGDSLRLGAMATTLLITDLSESQFVDVVSQDRLDDLLKLVGQEGVRKADQQTVAEIARRAKAKWILQGNVPPATDQLLVNVEIVEAATGKVIGTEQVACGGATSIFCVVDKLTRKIKKDLALSDSALNEYDPPVAEITTHSPEAYRHYLEGIECRNKYYDEEAQESFRKALEFDSTFAMAYYRLAWPWWGYRKEMITKAMQYSAKASQKDRLYIQSRDASVSGRHAQAILNLKEIIGRYPEEKEAYYLLGYHQYIFLGEYEEALHNFDKVIKLDSLYKRVYSERAYTYDKLGDFAGAMSALDKYIALFPNEATPYDSKAELYAWNGMLDESIEAGNQALTIKPDYHITLTGNGQAYLFKRQYAQAESCFQAVATVENTRRRSIGRANLALIPIVQGKFQEAQKVLHKGLATDTVDGFAGDYHNFKLALLASVYAERGNLDSAIMVFPQSILSWQIAYIRLLADNDDFAGAEAAVGELKKSLESRDQSFMRWYWYGRGYISFAQGEFPAATDHFTRAVNLIADPRALGSFPLHAMLGRSYMETGRYAEAVAEFEPLITFYSIYRLFWGTWSIKIHYWAAQAYEGAGRTSEAIKQYEEFLGYWGNGDPGIKAVDDAKIRLAKLKLAS
ncbi:tetratricopeptide repeat protein [Candidatus Zixiibacteriota bacterium]